VGYDHGVIEYKITAPHPRICYLLLPLLSPDMLSNPSPIYTLNSNPALSLNPRPISVSVSLVPPSLTVYPLWFGSTLIPSLPLELWSNRALAFIGNKIVRLMDYKLEKPPLYKECEWEKAAT